LAAAAALDQKTQVKLPDDNPYKAYAQSLRDSEMARNLGIKSSS
jgi:hypothetical protein